jgi:group I intron endonuclease
MEYIGDRNLFHCCGIYKITNEFNGKVYIGSSKEIYHRIAKHTHLLIRGRHDNEHLQNSYKLHKEHFKVVVIEECSEYELAERENHWISLLQSTDRSKGYNKATATEDRKNIVAEETKTRISKTLMNNASVWMCDKKTGKRIECFDSLFDAAKYIINESITMASSFNVRMKISQAARGKEVSSGHNRRAVRRSAYGFKWEIIK